MAPPQCRLSASRAAAVGFLAGAVQLAFASQCIQVFSDAEDYYPPRVRSVVTDRSDLSTNAAIVQFAQLFDLKYGNYFKVLTERRSKEQYVLKQCGAPDPTEVEVNSVAALPTDYVRKSFEIPLTQVATSSSVQMAFLEDLGLMDRVRYVAKTAVGSCWQKTKGCNGDTGGYEGTWGNAAIRDAQDAVVEAVFSDCYGECTSNNNKTKYILFSGSQDPGPLHTAEHIKFLAAFFNKEAEANRIFNDVKEAYDSLVATAGNDALTVAWINWNSFSSQYQISLAGYKTRFVADAGGQNVDVSAVLNNHADFKSSPIGGGTELEGVTLSVAPSDFGGNRSLAAAAFTPALAGVDVVIDETYSPSPRTYSFDTFLSNFFLDESSTLPFIANRKVFRQDGSISSSNALDWFESRMAHPERMLSDLKKAMSGQSGTRHYLRDIGAGETPRVISENACGVKLPSCNEADAPAEIPLPFGEETTSHAGPGKAVAGLPAVALVAAAGLVAACKP